MILLSMTQERHERSLLLVFILNELFLLFISVLPISLNFKLYSCSMVLLFFFGGGGRLGSLAVDSIGDNI